MSSRSLIICIILGLFISLIFLLYPAIDIHTSRYFYHPGSGFVWAHANDVRTFRKTMYALLWLFVACLAVLLILGIFNQTIKKLIRPQICLYLLLCLAIGPGLVVNGILKNHWGRPRPHQITQFDGHLHFEPAWVMSNQCPTNCSFVCGDASIGFFLFAFIPLVRRKKLMTTVAIAAGLGLGVMRIAQGGHFLSDVLLSGVVNYLCVYLVYYGFKRFDHQLFTH